MGKKMMYEYGNERLKLAAYTKLQKTHPVVGIFLQTVWSTFKKMLSLILKNPKYVSSRKNWVACMRWLTTNDALLQCKRTNVSMLLEGINNWNPAGISVWNNATSVPCQPPYLHTITSSTNLSVLPSDNSRNCYYTSTFRFLFVLPSTSFSNSLHAKIMTF